MKSGIDQRLHLWTVHHGRHGFSDSLLASGKIVRPGYGVGPQKYGDPVGSCQWLPKLEFSGRWDRFGGRSSTLHSHIVHDLPRPASGESHALVLARGGSFRSHPAERMGVVGSGEDHEAEVVVVTEGRREIGPCGCSWPRGSVLSGSGKSGKPATSRASKAPGEIRVNMETFTTFCQSAPLLRRNETCSATIRMRMQRQSG